jgi:hypothetical protein
MRCGCFVLSRRSVVPKAIEKPDGWVAPSKEVSERLRAAGFVLVVRWVDVAHRDDVPLKTIEALTLLDRREAVAKTVAANIAAMKVAALKRKGR